MMTKIMMRNVRCIVIPMKRFGRVGFGCRIRTNATFDALGSFQIGGQAMTGFSTCIVWEHTHMPTLVTIRGSIEIHPWNIAFSLS